MNHHTTHRAAPVCNSCPKNNSQIHLPVQILVSKLSLIQITILALIQIQIVTVLPVQIRSPILILFSFQNSIPIHIQVQICVHAQIYMLNTIPIQIHIPIGRLDSDSDTNTYSGLPFRPDSDSGFYTDPDFPTNSVYQRWAPSPILFTSLIFLQSSICIPTQILIYCFDSGFNFIHNA